ncbi:MAG: D-2-hydroxyacid dehydrogenase [Ignavibacteriae bacterium]|nr:D-2-hydroxyacid dehydrogenase [Ignavibacteriota bacterium]
MKILIPDGISKEGAKLLIEAGHELNQTKFTPEELLAAIPEYDAIIVRSATKVTKDVIDTGAKLKVIARGGVGLDNIDVAYAKSKGIPVLNTPGASAISVAELAVGHMFAVSRFLHESSGEMRQGKWPKKEYAKGIELYNKTLGVLGFGSIGKEVARRGIGLGMKVIAFDPLYAPMRFDVEITSKEDVIRRADFLTLHLPLDKQAGPTIGAAEFAMMKDGVVLINCARGGVVDEAALLDALNSGKVYAAGIDVFVNEPATEAQQALIAHPRVSATPHIGAQTVEAQDRVSIEIAEKVIAGLAG